MKDTKKNTWQTTVLSIYAMHALLRFEFCIKSYLENDSKMIEERFEKEERKDDCVRYDISERHEEKEWKE